jgi:hypothetical protein
MGTPIRTVCVPSVGVGHSYCNRLLVALVISAAMITGLLVVDGGRAAPMRQVAWLSTLKMAQSKLPDRFHNIGYVRCVPDQSSASRVIGNVRWWNRFQCTGATRDGVAFSLTYVARGKCSNCWAIVHLRGTGAEHLKGSSAAVTPSPPAGVPPTSGVDRGGFYAFTGTTWWIQNVGSGGAIVTLSDGSIWQVSPLDRIDTVLWLPVDDVVVVNNQGALSALYPYLLINKDEGETAEAQYLGS